MTLNCGPPQTRPWTIPSSIVCESSTRKLLVHSPRPLGPNPKTLVEARRLLGQVRVKRGTLRALEGARERARALRPKREGTTDTVGAAAPGDEIGARVAQERTSVWTTGVVTDVDTSRDNKSGAKDIHITAPAACSLWRGGGGLVQRCVFA